MPEGRSDRTLVIMLKAPVAGAVKTRLARSIGMAEAARFYRAQTAALLRRLARDRRWHTILAVAPDAAVRAPFWPPRCPRVPQGGGDLGTRLQRLLDLSRTGPVVIIGSDIPSIRPRDIVEAFRLLGRHPIVFGPATDGGYWLVGARRRPTIPRLFANVRWSTPHALADTRRNVTGVAGIIIARSDVDTETDWRRWRRLASVAW